MQRAAVGKPPKALIERTEVLPHLLEAFHAFFDLSPGRTIHMGGEGYISVQEIEAYCALAGIHDPEDRLDLFRLIRAMDAAFLADRDERRAKEEAKEKDGGR